MRALLLPLLLLLVAALVQASFFPVFVTPDQCVSNSPQNPCTSFGPRDLLFVIDASMSMDPGTLARSHAGAPALTFPPRRFP